MTRSFFAYASAGSPFYSERVIDVETFSVVNAHRDDGKRFFVRAQEKLAAFVELESTLGAAANSLD
jgi:hypothetical protein